MKRVTLFAFCILTIFSCTHTKQTTKNEMGLNTITLHEGKWYSNFKDEVFIRCIKRLYPQKFGHMIDSLDASHAANLDQLDYDSQIEGIADSLATVFTKRNEARWTIENRKIIFNVCLNYRNSAELDQLAVRLYRKNYESKTKTKE